MRFERKRALFALGFALACLSYLNFETKPFAWAAADSWVYPVASQEVVRDFSSPNGDYSAGHRGIDFSVAEGEPVLAVASGTVRFAGKVAGRGIVSLTLPDGFVAEVEPVCPLVATGDQVVAGQQVATFCALGSSHCQQIGALPETSPAAGASKTASVSQCLHLSARRFGSEYPRGFAYVTPLLLLGAFAPSHLVAVGSLE